MFSSNHKQITGDFAEHLTMYWLSKKGIECTHVRHTGIDIIASFGSVRWGISVKARSRKDWQENYGFTINKPYEHIQKVKKLVFILAARNTLLLFWIKKVKSLVT